MTNRPNNDIFKDIPKEAVDQISNDVVQDDFGWTVPYEIVPLPSKGLLYSKESPLHGKSSLKIKAMTAREEDILASLAFMKEGSTIKNLIAACICDKSINVDDLLVGDRNSLMVAIRITGYGTNYSASVPCKNCGITNKKVFSLGEIGIKSLNLEPVSEGSNIFSYTLPVSKKEVHFKFRTIVEDNERRREEQRRQAVLGIKEDRNVTNYLRNAIVAVSGITERHKIEKFIDSMPAYDSRSLRKFIEDNEPDVDLNMEYNCDNCRSEGIVRLPITSEFFWPSEQL